MKNSKVYLTASVLTLAGISIFLYKLLSLGFPLTPDTTARIWSVEASVTFSPLGKSAKVSAFIPKSSNSFSILDESFLSRGFGLSTITKDSNRVAEWSIRRVWGRQTLFYRAVVRELDQASSTTTTKPPLVEPPTFEGADLEAAKAILDEAKSQSADTLSQIRAVVQRIQSTERDDETTLLLGAKPSELDRLELACKILALDRVPLRIVHGIELSEPRRNVPLVRWLETHQNGSWVSLDAMGNPSEALARNLAWWRGADPIGIVTGGTRLNIQIAVSRHEESALTYLAESGKSEKPFLLDFSLFSLPLQTQGVFRVMLLVPLGGLLIVFLRNVIGLPTFGTFMPVLVALSFRETDIFMGCLFFSIVVALGLTVRFWLEKLKLLLVPRLAAVLTIVVLLLALVAITSHKLGIEHGLSIALFPMVILTMTIERMSIVWDELGAGDAIKQGLGSLLAAVLATFLITNEAIEHLFFVFPELLLVVTAVCLLLGRYTGYRLTELRRFRALAEQP